MAILHPQLRMQLRAMAHRVGRAAVPDDDTLRGDTLMTDSEATKPRTKADELYAAGSTEITYVMVDLILAFCLVIAIASIVAGSTWGDALDLLAWIGDTLMGVRR